MRTPLDCDSIPVGNDAGAQSTDFNSARCAYQCYLDAAPSAIPVQQMSEESVHAL